MKRLLFTLIAAAAVSACAKDDAVAPSTSDNVVKFSSSEIETRIDTNENEWIEDKDRIGITTNGFSSVTNGVDFVNVQYQAESSGDATAFTLTGGESAILYPNVAASSSNSVDFYAYYPYTTTAYSSESVKVDISDQSDLAAIDFMVGRNSDDTDNVSVTGYGDGANDSEVAFRFYHKLSKLILNIELNDNIATLKGLKVEMLDIETEGVYSVVDGSQSETLAIEDVTLAVVEGAEDASGNVTGATVTAILHPKSYSTNSPTLKFAANGKIYEVTFAATLTAGCSHIFSLALGNDETLFTSDSTIGSWTPGTGGTLFPEDVTPISFVDEI